MQDAHDNKTTKQNDTLEVIPLDQLKTKLEEEGKNKVQELKKANGTVNDLIKIMTDGSEEFKKNTGRNMTYSQMRELYG
jgi:hypothetical protein